MKLLTACCFALSVGLTANVAIACTNDLDCTCGQVCNWGSTHTCVDGDAGSPGWCTPGTTANGSACLYETQTCVAPHSCEPSYEDINLDAGTPVCLAVGSTAGTTSSGTGTTGAGSTTGSGSSTGGTGAGTTGGGATGTVCTNDLDCACGQVCSWVGANETNHICVAASSGDPGWCTPGTTANGSACLYQGQSCSGTACTPAWTSSSVCNKTSSSGGTSGSTSSGGGCSSTSGGVSLAAGLLALGLLVRSRRRP